MSNTTVYLLSLDENDGYWSQSNEHKFTHDPLKALVRKWHSALTLLAYLINQTSLELNESFGGFGFCPNNSKLE